MDDSKRERLGSDCPSVDSDMNDVVNDGLLVGGDAIDKGGVSDMMEGLGEKENKIKTSWCWCWCWC